MRGILTAAVIAVLAAPLPGRAAEIQTGPLNAGSSTLKPRITVCNVKASHDLNVTLSVCNTGISTCDSIEATVAPADCAEHTGIASGFPQFGRLKFQGLAKTVRATFALVDSTGTTTIAVAGVRR